MAPKSEGTGYGKLTIRNPEDRAQGGSTPPLRNFKYMPKKKSRQNKIEAGVTRTSLNQTKGQAGPFPSSSLVGQKINDYLVEADLSTGGMGVVLLCRKGADDVVVLKACRASDSIARQLFNREAENWIKLPPHPNIVTAKEIFNYSVPGLGFRHWLALEHVAGPLLMEFALGEASPWQRSKPNNNFTDNIRHFKPKEILRCLLDICCGMEHIALHGIHAHGDLKPQNILIGYDGRAKITDFGLSGMREEGYHSGDYTAPEVKNEQPPDTKSDIYSFGEIIIKDMLGANKGCLVKLEDIAKDCTAKSAAKRPANFSDLTERLRLLYKATFDEDYPRLPLVADDAKLLMNKAVSLFSLPLDDHKIILSLLEKAETIDPNLAELYFYKGRVHLFLKDYDNAIFAYRRAIELEPDNANTYHILGVALSMANHRRSKDEQISLYRKAIELYPDFAAAYFSLGNCLKEQGKKDEAIEAYQKAIALNPHDSFYYSTLGHALWGQFKLDDAVSAYRKAVELVPGDASSYVALGSILGILEKSSEALEAYKEVVKLRPDSSDAYYSLGLALDGQGKFNEAVTAYRKAIDLKPKPDTYNLLGCTLRKLGEFDSAVEAHQKAIELKQGKSFDSARYYYNLGLTLMDQDKFEKAAVAYKSALEISPDSCAVYDDLCIALTCQGKNQEAAEYQRKSVNAYFNAGKGLIAMGYKKDARQRFQKALGILNSLNELTSNELEMKQKIIAFLQNP